MPKPTASAHRDPYLILRNTMRKSVNALDADVAWQKYRDQLAQLEAKTDRENERQRMAWGAYQQLLAQNHALIRSEPQAKPLGAAFSHARKVAKKKGKAGSHKVQHAIAQRYLTSHGHKRMGDS